MARRILFALLVTMSCFLLLLGSCNSLQLKPNSNLTVYKQKAFLQLINTITVNICKAKQCQKRSMVSYGSSAIFKHTEKHTYLITAAHNFRGPRINPRFLMALKASGATVHLSSSVKVRSFSGRDYKVLQVVESNQLSDLAVFKIKRANLPHYEIATRHPQKGDKLYNISAPRGFYGRSMAFMTTGMVLGYQAFYLSNLGVYMAHSCPTAKDSSGSPVLNTRGEIVGVTSRVLRGFQHIAFASSLMAIREITSGISED